MIISDIHQRGCAGQRCGSDGFVSVNAPYAGGEFVTRPLTFSGSELSINYATSAAGSVHVELQDAHGRPLDGFELGSSIKMFGDEIDRRVAWKDRPDLSSLADRPIRVRFVLKDADLYALQFSDIITGVELPETSKGGDAGAR